MSRSIFKTNWNALAKKVHSNSIEKGWWGENEQPLESYLMLINCELCEAVEADRCSNHLLEGDIVLYKECYETTDDFSTLFENCIKGTVEEELADAIIRMLDLSGAHGVDLSHTSGHACNFANSSQFIKKSFIEVLMETCNIITSELTKKKLPLDICMANILAYCSTKEIDITFVIEEKMKYNELRPYMHGGKKY